jgi:glycosyltransferase involved in cell wall biosynthesis
MGKVQTDNNLKRSSTLRFGIDGIPLHEALTGVGHYTIELSRALAREAPSEQFELLSQHPYLPSIKSNDDLNATPPNLHIVQTVRNRLNRYWWLIGLPQYIRQHGVSLFHGTNYDIPLWNFCPTVLTIHDLSLLLYSQTHEAQSVRRGRRRLPLMARTATMIVTPSESVRREVCEHLGIAPQKVVSVVEAARRVFRPVPEVETIETRKRLGIEDDFLLFVGTLEPRKNLVTLVRAFAALPRSENTKLPQLVIVGRKGWLNDDLFATVKASGVEGRINLTGYLSDEELCALYSSCRVFIYPSLYEGFGLPPLEAMACGAPVVTSRIASIAEVTGEAARLFAPEDVEALTRELHALLNNEDERRHLAALGLKRAAEFSWERTARETREVYDEALRRAGKR